MKVNKLKVFFGYKYVLNTVTKELHYLKSTKVSCQIPLLVNYVYLTKKKALKLIKEGKVDGCTHCLKSLSLD